MSMCFSSYNRTNLKEDGGCQRGSTQLRSKEWLALLARSFGRARLASLRGKLSSLAELSLGFAAFNQVERSSSKPASFYLLCHLMNGRNKPIKIGKSG